MRRAVSDTFSSPLPTRQNAAPMTDSSPLEPPALLPQRCGSCGAVLVGEYCATCGQRRLEGRLSLWGLIEEVARRVFRFDRAFAVTFWRMVREPGRLVCDYLEGRRAGIADPIYYLFSCVFVQLAVSGFTHWVAPVWQRESALRWLGQIGGVAAIKVLSIFWMGTLWRVVFGARRYNLAEIYVFSMYAFGTTGLLWAALPLIDLAVPYPLGARALTVLLATLAIEVVYLTYAIWRFSRLPLWECTVRVLVVLCIGYGLLVGLIGARPVAQLLLPTLHELP
jgi:hypothetical protein